MQACDILVKGLPAGSLEVYRLEPGTKPSEASFLKEEQDLLDAIGGRLGKLIERRRIESSLRKSEQRFKNLVENSLVGISIVQDNRVIFQNQEQEKLLGPLTRNYVLGNFDNIHPDDVEAVMQANRDIQRGVVPRQDLDFRLFPDGGDAKEQAPKLNKAAARLLGMWEIHKIKEPGKHYQRSYRGRPLVAKGPHAFTLIIQYREDGSFVRTTRAGRAETVQEGKWSLTGHELRQTRQGNLPDEVMYIRFDGPNKFTSIEVYEDCSHPGTFAQFKRVSQ